MKSKIQHYDECYSAPVVEWVSVLGEEGFAASNTPTYEDDGELDI